MDDKQDGTGNSGKGNLDFEGAWPQRPQRPRPEPARPRLDPPKERTHRGQSSDRDEIPAWTAHPTSSERPDPKDTLILPLTLPSRSDNGQPQTPDEQSGSQASYAPASPSRRNFEREPYSNAEDPTKVYEPAQWAQAQSNRARPVDDPRAALPRVHTARTAAPSSRAKQAMDFEPKRRGPWGWIGWALGGIVALALVVVIAFSLAWQGQYAGKLYAGVTMLGMPLGGKTQNEARQAIQEKIQAFVAQPVVFSWQGKEWRPSAEQIGLKVDAGKSIGEAFNVGRGGDLLTNVSQQWLAAQHGFAVPLEVQLSEPTLEAYLSTIASNEINEKLFEGDIRLNGTEVVALPGKEGRTLKVYDTIVAVRQAVSSLNSASKVGLPVEVVQPAITAGEVGGVQSQLAVRISEPLTATVPTGKTFTLDREALVRFTTIERNPDRTAKNHVDLGWRDNELNILAGRWAAEASSPAQNARFAWNNGAISVISESIQGFKTSPAAIASSIKEHAATADKRVFELPGQPITPTVSSKDLGSLGIKELIGSGLSTFKGSSPERATNIRVAAGLLNGTVIPPGETFSFLQAMGGIDEAHGFVPGYVIAAERTQLGVGGGVCQVSTTTFRAAFWSGLQITERNQHSYRVGWYEANGEPVGFDAAVFDPGVDLKFVNTTPGYILVEAGTGPDSLTVNLYGTKIAQAVKLEGPAISNKVPAPPDVYEVDSRLPTGTKKQVETAHGGLDTVVTRRIQLTAGGEKADAFRSSYKAWPNWYIVASASQIPSGAQAQKPTPTAQP